MPVIRRVVFLRMLVTYVLHALMCWTNTPIQVSHVMTSINYMNIREPFYSIIQTMLLLCDWKKLLQQNYETFRKFEKGMITCSLSTNMSDMMTCNWFLRVCWSDIGYLNIHALKGTHKEFSVMWHPNRSEAWKGLHQGFKSWWVCWLSSPCGLEKDTSLQTGLVFSHF